MKRHELTVVALTVVLIGGFFAPTEAVALDPTGHIVYVRANAADTQHLIGSMNADGSHQKKVSTERDSAPAYSPDGQRIAFSSLRDTPPGWEGERLYYSELYVMNADGSNVERITVNEGLVDFQPTWSPNGNRILVARGPSIAAPPDQLTGPTDLWIINLDTGRERQLTNSPDTWEGYADWSPDGNRIAFESNLLDPGNFDLYTIRVDGSGLERLTSDPVWDAEPHYSPDGNHVSFTIYSDNVDVYTIRVDGSGQRRLTSDLGSDFTSVYSPDGRFIAFASDRDGSYDIFVMRADGTHETNLTRTRSFSEWDPDWQPR